jgi:hypothetical protein
MGGVTNNVSGEETYNKIVYIFPPRDPSAILVAL